MSSRAKGNRRERQAREILEEAGYIVDTRPAVQYQNTDYFNLFDLIAVKPGEKIRFIQVKSNGARGIRATVEECAGFMPFEHVILEYWVCYDDKGWRVIELNPDGHTDVCDERDDSENMGVGVLQFLNS